MRCRPDIYHFRKRLDERAVASVAAPKGGRGATSAASVTGQTLEEISELIQLRELAVELLPEGEVRQSIQIELAQLRRLCLREAAHRGAGVQ